MDFKPGDKVKIRAWDSTYCEIVKIISKTEDNNLGTVLRVTFNGGAEEVRIVKNCHIISANRNYTKEDIKQAGFLLDGQNVSNIVCPYCGYKHEPFFDDYEDCEKEECPKCGKVFSYVVENNPTFTTSRKD